MDLKGIMLDEMSDREKQILYVNAYMEPIKMLQMNLFPGQK